MVTDKEKAKYALVMDTIKSMSRRFGDCMFSLESISAETGVPELELFETDNFTGILATMCDNGFLIRSGTDFEIDSSENFDSATPLVGVLAEVDRERLRQIAKGFDAAHDDSHKEGSILTAAWLIIGHTQNDRGDGEQVWPRELNIHVKEKYPKDYRQRLVIAAALIAAEIERMDRAV